MYSDLIEMDLHDMMAVPLPNKTYQRKLQYRPLQSEVEHTYHLLNKHVFGGKLKIPEITIAPRRIKYWGMCIGEHEVQKTGSFCKIELIDKWFCPQWMVMILAHEMCHQYQWDVIGEERIQQKKYRLMSHGPTFFDQRHLLHALGIPLRRRYSAYNWLDKQDVWAT